jgi:small nuclear ribonucleoprotein (snRNP)-like protein
MINYERPLDFLNSQKGNRVIVKIKGQDKDVVGVLCSFDIHINILIYKDDGSIQFIKGDNLISIS